MENDKIKREEIVSKWDSLGLLDGLKGHVKGNIAQLYEGCKRMVKNEETGEWECCEEGKNCDDNYILPVSVRLINNLPPDQEIVTVIKYKEE